MSLSRPLTFALLLMAPSVWADDSLLWKATNPASPQVVPMYAGVGSPFPVKALQPEEVSATAIMDEQARLREEALTYAQGLLRTNAALQPQLHNIRIGGTLLGTQGARVLINNEWIGVGSHVRVRQVQTPEALNALKVLAEYDSVAATELRTDLNARLSANPAIALKVIRITAKTVVLDSPQGPVTLSIPVNP